MNVTTDELGKVFGFLDAWKNLRIHRKFMQEEGGNGVKSIALDGSDDSDQFVPVKQRKLFFLKCCQRRKSRKNSRGSQTSQQKVSERKRNIKNVDEKTEASVVFIALQRQVDATIP